MKNVKPKNIAIGAGLTAATAGLTYAAPLIAQLYAGQWWMAAITAAVPTLIAYLTDSRKKVEGE